MKWSNTILITALLTGLAGLFGSNALIKKVYESIDKSDKYWNFKKLTDQPFKHIRITGGNVSNIVYDQSPQSSVKVLPEWHGSDDGTVKAMVKNDTLVIDYANTYRDIYEKHWLRDAVTVRISGPEVKSVTGSDTRLMLNKYNQPALKVDLSGNSRLVVNSYRTQFEKLDVNLSDSSLTTISMSDETFTKDIIKIDEVNATGRGMSLLNLRSSSIERLHLDLADSASVALSGYTLTKWNNRSLPDKNR